MCCNSKTYSASDRTDFYSSQLGLINSLKGANKKLPKPIVYLGSLVILYFARPKCYLSHHTGSLVSFKFDGKLAALYKRSDCG